MFSEFTDMIGRQTYDSRNLRLASGTENLAAIVDYGRTVGVDCELFDSALRSFRRAGERGVGVNLAATFEILRQASTEPPTAPA